jgi:iron-sulfur cluster repair protein YtfE (RIC family)
MKRHRSLAPLSHDHHHALVQASRLQAADEASDSNTVARAFLRYFAEEAVRHFREEEEVVFPAVLDFPVAREPVIQALLEHVRLHALSKALRHALDSGNQVTPIMHELGELLVAHLRHEERCLFPLIEGLLDDSSLAAIGPVAREGEVGADLHHASSEMPRELRPTEPTVTLFWGSGGGSHCDAAFLGDRRWRAKDPRSS